jgi:hypothetical protein
MGLITTKNPRWQSLAGSLFINFRRFEIAITKSSARPGIRENDPVSVPLAQKYRK